MVELQDGYNKKNNNVEKTALIALTVLMNTVCFAQRRIERSFEVLGLPDGDEITSSLKIAIPLIIVGLLIAYIFMWSRKEDTDNPSTYIGCLGIVIVVVGLFFLLPLLAWVEYIFTSILSIGIAIVVVVVIIYIIYSVLTSKK